ncbi:hypothetical protein TNIN_128481 [Trichonephila inaurata madagascariensis]|uniref:Uncharacterized protein n=1 Tax=Trichonephila inaurata madagascariensis TaxID=2747483 RepID=A0A8X6MJ99_9ARAC|nr:hypothetical protein TNIN_128481 [Trichonephila inaurata madagascariensis]
MDHGPTGYIMVKNSARVKRKTTHWGQKNQEWKTKENGRENQENELNSKLQGTLRENKILKRILQRKRLDKSLQYIALEQSEVKSYFTTSFSCPLQLHLELHSHHFQTEQI